MIVTFAEQVRIEAVNSFNTGIVNGKFPASTAFVDVSDMERFAFLVKSGTLNSEMTLQVQQATAANGTPKAVTGAVKVVAAVDGNKTFLIEVETRRLDIAGGFRFVTLDITGAAGGDDHLAILFLGLNPGKAPVTQPASTVAPVVVAG